ncbi:hypothetical protein T484DRAFT_1624726, partial [Baffinella frigidus]
HAGMWFPAPHACQPRGPTGSPEHWTTCGHVVTWPCGHVGMWSRGHVVQGQEQPSVGLRGVCSGEFRGVRAALQRGGCVFTRPANRFAEPGSG